jgi:hypothetical protein
MLDKNRRGNLVWVAFIAFAMLIFLGTGAIAPLLVSAAAVLLVIVAANGARLQLPQRQRRPQQDMTRAARAARLQGTYRPAFDDYYTLQDIGLVIDEQDRNGLRIRQARVISMDDRAVRPYVVVSAPRDGRHPAQVLVRFEMTDASGKSQFIYEMDYYMRPAENAILPDYRLPLKENQRLGRAGQWDLQVWVNGGLLGVHSFNMAPSHATRQAQFSPEGEVRGRLEAEDDPMPVSLEELLAQQHQSASGQ